MTATQIESKIAHFQQQHKLTASHLVMLEGAIAGLRELLDEFRVAEKEAAEKAAAAEEEAAELAAMAAEVAAEENDTEAPL